MAFPTVESVTETAWSSTTSDHEAALPSTVTADDLLLAIFTGQNDGADLMYTPKRARVELEASDDGEYRLRIRGRREQGERVRKFDRAVIISVHEYMAMQMALGAPDVKREESLL